MLLNINETYSKKLNQIEKRMEKSYFVNMIIVNMIISFLSRYSIIKLFKVNKNENNKMYNFNA